MTAQDLALRLRRATPEQLQIFSEGYLLLDAAVTDMRAALDRQSDWTDAELEELTEDMQR